MTRIECTSDEESESTSQSIQDKLLIQDYTLHRSSQIVLPVQMYTSGSQHIQFVQHSTTTTITTTSTTTTGLASETLLPEFSSNMSEKYPQI